MLQGSRLRLSRARSLVLSALQQSSGRQPLGWESGRSARRTWTGRAFPLALWAGRFPWSPRSWGEEPTGHEPGPALPPALPLARPLAVGPGGVADLGLGAPAVAARASLLPSRGCGPGGRGGWAALGFPRRLPRPPWATHTTRGRPPAAPGPAASGGSGGRRSGRQVGAGGGGGAGREEGLPAAAAAAATAAAPPGAWWV